VNYKQRQDFRKTRKWKEFKCKCRLHTSKDFITKKPLERGWNLHHLDLNVCRYDDLSDMNRFMPLNAKTHEIIHELYKWYSKDHKVLDRIKITLDKMEEYTNGPTQRLSILDKELGTASDTVHAQQDRKSVHPAE